MCSSCGRTGFWFSEIFDLSRSAYHRVGWHAVVCYGAPEWFRYSIMTAVTRHLGGALCAPIHPINRKGGHEVWWNRWGVTEVGVTERPTNRAKLELEAPQCGNKPTYRRGTSELDCSSNHGSFKSPLRTSAFTLPPSTWDINPPTNSPRWLQ